MEELAKVLSQFGTSALWGVVIYKVLDFAEVIGVFYIIFLFCKRFGPAIIEFLAEL